MFKWVFVCVFQNGKLFHTIRKISCTWAWVTALNSKLEIKRNVEINVSMNLYQIQRVFVCFLAAITIVISLFSFLLATWGGGLSLIKRARIVYTICKFSTSLRCHIFLCFFVLFGKPLEHHLGINHNKHQIDFVRILGVHLLADLMWICFTYPILINRETETTAWYVKLINSAAHCFLVIFKFKNIHQPEIEINPIPLPHWKNCENSWHMTWKKNTSNLTFIEHTFPSR